MTILGSAIPLPTTAELAWLAGLFEDRPYLSPKHQVHYEAVRASIGVLSIWL